MNTKFTSLFSAIVATFASSSICASDRWEINLGVALSAGPQYFGSEEAEYYIFPISEATYHLSRNAKFYAGTNNGIGLEFNSEWIVAGAAVGYRYGLYGAQDVAIVRDKPEELEGMVDPGDTATIKPYLATNNERWNLKFTYEKGLNSENEGATGRVDFSYNYFFNEDAFGKIALHSIWADESYVDSYFGISDDEITLNRPYYQGESGLYSNGFNAEFNYMFDPQNVFFASTQVNYLQSDIRESSIVQQNYYVELTMGYVYLF